MGLLIPIEGAEYPGDIKHTSRVAMSLLVADAEAQKTGTSTQSLSVSDVYKWPAVQSMLISGLTRGVNNSVLETSHTREDVAVHSLMVGGISTTAVKQSVDVEGGE